MRRLIPSVSLQVAGCRWSIRRVASTITRPAMEIATPSPPSHDGMITFYTAARRTLRSKGVLTIAAKLAHVAQLVPHHHDVGDEVRSADTNVDIKVILEVVRLLTPLERQSGGDAAAALKPTAQLLDEVIRELRGDVAVPLTRLSAIIISEFCRFLTLSPMDVDPETVTLVHAQVLRAVAAVERLNVAVHSAAGSFLNAAHQRDSIRLLSVFLTSVPQQSTCTTALVLPLQQVGTMTLIATLQDRCLSTLQACSEEVEGKGIMNALRWLVQLEVTLSKVKEATSIRLDDVASVTSVSVAEVAVRRLLCPVLPFDVTRAHALRGSSPDFAPKLLRWLGIEDLGTRIVAVPMVIDSADRFRQLLLQLAAACYHTSAPTGTQCPSVAMLIVDAEFAGTLEGDAVANKDDEALLSCLRPLKAWLSVLAAGHIVPTVQLSVKSIVVLLQRCLFRLRRRYEEDARLLLEQKPRVHDAKEVVTTLDHLTQLPERDVVLCIRTDEDISSLEALQRLSRTAAWLVRRALDARRGLMQGEGAMSALLTGGVERERIMADENAYLRNLAHRVVEPLLKAYYSALVATDDADQLKEAKEQLLEAIRGPTDEVLGVTLQHPLQCSVMALVESWRRAALMSQLEWFADSSMLFTDEAAMTRAIEILAQSAAVLLDRVDSELEVGDESGGSLVGSRVARGVLSQLGWIVLMAWQHAVRGGFASEQLLRVLTRVAGDIEDSSRRTVSADDDPVNFCKTAPLELSELMSDQWAEEVPESWARCEWRSSHSIFRNGSAVDGVLHVEHPHQLLEILSATDLGNQKVTTIRVSVAQPHTLRLWIDTLLRLLAIQETECSDKNCEDSGSVDTATTTATEIPIVMVIPWSSLAPCVAPMRLFDVDGASRASMDDTACSLQHLRRIASSKARWWLRPGDSGTGGLTARLHVACLSLVDQLWLEATPVS